MWQRKGSSVKQYTTNLHKHQVKFLWYSRDMVSRVYCYFLWEVDTMHWITGFFRDLFVKMLRALLIWGAIAGAASTGFVFVTSRHAPLTAEWVLIGLVTVIAALLGMVSALTWEMTHIPQILRLARGHHSQQEEPVAVAASTQEPEADRR
jgi:hypothetical protein